MEGGACGGWGVWRVGHVEGGAWEGGVRGGWRVGRGGSGDDTILLQEIGNASRETITFDLSDRALVWSKFATGSE